MTDYHYYEDDLDDRRPAPQPRRAARPVAYETFADEPATDPYGDNSNGAYAGDDDDDGHARRSEALAPAPERRIRFDPRRERGAHYFSRAHRHSRMVRILKFALPGVALAGVAGFFLIMQSPILDEDAGKAVITLAGVDVESKSLTMERPNISGFEGTRHAYEVEALEAVQDLDNPNVATLTTLIARFGVGAGVAAVVNATTGVFDSGNKTLLLRDGIEMETTDGYKAKFEDAFIDLTNRTLRSSKPVEISDANGVIRANSIEIAENGARIVFGGGVTVTYTPPEGSAMEAAGTVPAGDVPPSAADGNS